MVLLVVQNLSRPDLTRASDFSVWNAQWFAVTLAKYSLYHKSIKLWNQAHVLLHVSYMDYKIHNCLNCAPIPLIPILKLWWFCFINCRLLHILNISKTFSPHPPHDKSNRAEINFVGFQFKYILCTNEKYCGIPFLYVCNVHISLPELKWRNNVPTST
jgi:hypothetical protein